HRIGDINVPTGVRLCEDWSRITRVTRNHQAVGPGRCAIHWNAGPWIEVQSVIGICAPPDIQGVARSEGTSLAIRATLEKIAQVLLRSQDIPGLLARIGVARCVSVTPCGHVKGFSFGP